MPILDRRHGEWRFYVSAGAVYDEYMLQHLAVNLRQEVRPRASMTLRLLCVDLRDIYMVVFILPQGSSCLHPFYSYQNVSD